MMFAEYRRVLYPGLALVSKRSISEKSFTPLSQPEWRQIYHIFKDPPDSWFELIDKMCEREKQDGIINMPVQYAYKTHTHSTIYESLHRRTDNLMKGNYEKHVGLQSCTISGAKGIGKSSALESFVRLIPCYHPDLIPVYISADHDVAVRIPLGELIAEILREIQIEVPVPGKYRSWSDNIIDALEKSKKRMLLIVDEFDTIYTSQCERNIRHAVIGLCVNFANSRKGRVMTVLSGSVQSLPDLIRVKNTEAHKEKYPGILDARDMNGSKFEVLPVYASRPNDLSVLHSMLPNAPPNLINFISFFCGTNCRKVEKVIKKTIEYSQRKTSIQDLTTSLIPDEHEGYANSKLSSTLGKIVDLFIEINPGEFDNVIQDDHLINVEMVINKSWALLKPVDIMNHLDIFEGNLKEEQKNNAMLTLSALTDTNDIVVDNFVNGLPQNVMPSNLFSVAVRRKFRSNPSLVGGYWREFTTLESRREYQIKLAMQSDSWYDYYASFILRPYTSTHKK
jgi:hypothetical protein